MFSDIKKVFYVLTITYHATKAFVIIDINRKILSFDLKSSYKLVF